MRCSPLVAVLLCCCLVAGLEAARLLAIFPVPARSHWMLEKPYLEALAARGHHVTAVTPYTGSGGEPPRPNYTVVAIPEVKHLLGGAANLFNVSLESAVVSTFFLFRYGINACDALLATPAVQQLYHSQQAFDVVIAESFFQDCFLAFAHRFRAHLILVAPYEGNHWTADAVGNPTPLAHVPDPFLRYTDRMGFLQRLHNAAFGTFQRLARRLYFLPALDAVVQRHLHDHTIPTIAELERRAALLLTHGHVSVGHPRPSVPARVDVGGLHIQPPKALPQDLQSYLDKSTAGAIYFSLGSNLNSSDMPERTRDAFLAAFSRLQQNVIWKWEADSLPGQPRNVMVSKWLPQADILAHENVRLFITHGGLLSTMEAVDRGVPLLAIPVYGDQMLNAIRAVQAGYARRIDFPHVTAENLHAEISELLTNTSYRSRARTLSALFRDRPRPPLEEALFWTEYVLRHGGAPHLRSAALQLAWYQLLLLDVVALVLAAALVLLAAVWLAWRLVCGGRRHRTAEEEKRTTRRRKQAAAKED